MIRQFRTSSRRIDYAGSHIALRSHINSQGGMGMKTLKAEDNSDRGADAANEDVGAGDATIVSEWDADAFHRRVSDLELQGYVVRRETYRVTPETNPETGRIVHLHTVELYQHGSDKVESLGSSETAKRP
jgi:hypothetical protein